MPISIKLFLGLFAVYIAWLIYVSHGVFFCPAIPAPSAMVLHQMPNYQEFMCRYWLSVTVTRFVLMAVVPLILAAVAVFARKNWARWALVVWLVLLEMMPLVPAVRAYFLMPDAFVSYYHNWSSVWHDILRARHFLHWDASTLPNIAFLVAKLVMIALLFLSNARPWFHRQAPTS
jgi:hypothetical protein